MPPLPPDCFETDAFEWQSHEEFATCIGMDALRICLGMEPENFTPAEVQRYFRAMVKQCLYKTEGEPT